LELLKLGADAQSQQQIAEKIAAIGTVLKIQDGQIATLTTKVNSLIDAHNGAMTTNGHLAILVGALAVMVCVLAVAMSWQTRKYNKRLTALEAK